MKTECDYDSNSYYHDTEPCRELTDTEWAALEHKLSDRLLRRTALRSARVGIDVAIRTGGLACN